MNLELTDDSDNSMVQVYDSAVDNDEDIFGETPIMS